MTPPAFVLIYLIVYLLAPLPCFAKEQININRSGKNILSVVLAGKEINVIIYTVQVKTGEECTMP